MAELLFFRDGNLQMRTALRQDRTVIGRASPADIVVPDAQVARAQCEVVRRAGGFALIDLSGKGTAVSRRLAHENGTALRDGDEIRLGPFALVFSAVDAPHSGELPAKARRTRIGPRITDSASALRTRLRVKHPEGEAVRPLRPSEGVAVVIGSDPDGPEGLIIKDAFVSASHCRIAWIDGRWVLTDLGSSNGTFVDGVSVLTCVLSGRRAVRVGETTVWFEQEFGESGGVDEPLPGLVTRDPAMTPVVESVRRIAPSQAPVFIHGETGAGKELVARAIHALSPRKDGPFVALNCGAIPRETAESELFGHERGAFTGADSARPGAFSEADGGTLFLDEVGELPPAIQVKMLRVLERGELRRLGGSRTVTVNVRIVSATHRDLPAAIEEDSFREDLYYRLCVAPIEVPPLRQRLADILALAERFAADLTGGAGEVSFTPEARAKLEAHRWPGNARELRNAVQRALLVRSSNLIGADDLVLGVAPRSARSADVIRADGQTLEEIEREAYRLAILRFPGDNEAAVRELDVSRSTFFRKIALFGLGPDRAARPPR